MMIISSRIVQVFFLWTVSSTLALREADFDIFPIAQSENEAQFSKRGPFQTIAKIAGVFNAAGGVYFGFQVARAISRLSKKKTLQVNHNNTDNLIEEIQLDQQELWRVVHKLYTTQSDKIATMSNSTDLTIKGTKTDIAHLKLSLEKDLKIISDRIDSLKKMEFRLNLVEKKVDEESSATAELESTWKSQFEALGRRIQNLQNEIPALILQQHELTMSKIREFMDSLRLKKPKQ
mmetsp:Transcript_5637/g.5836  ORF Transcript_5637/g.5836 Transcript_5637/m.5836 type:complete len:234 (+) Transcript_5637:109-810(+)